jgi:multidrug efflux pump subunit AcrB
MENQRSETVKYILIILLIVAIVIVGPLFLLWALNTLFPALAIPYTIWTWLAAFILGGAVTRGGK